jgi:hypothetical protein
MTREEILNMKLGEELDVLVATEVMGWGNAIKLSSGKWIANTPRYMNDKGWRFGDYRDYGVIPEYSTNITLAWEVIEELKDIFFKIRRDDDKWFCCFRSSDFCIADNIPEAICKSALLAKLT